MNAIAIVPVAFFQWLLTTSVLACMIVGLIVAGKKVFGKRLPARWHYALWFVLIVKLLMPRSLESPFNVWHLIPERPFSAVPVVMEAFSGLSQEASGGANLTMTILFAVWLCGAIGLAAYNAAVNWRFARRLRKQAVIGDPEVLRIFEACKELMHVRRPIRLIESEHVPGPALFGVFRPTLIVPRLQGAALRQDHLRYIFLHELAHVKRNDIAVNWIMRGLLIIHWFNPLLWFAYSRMREDQEAACDARVLASLREDESKSYGLTLIELFEQTAAPPRMAGMASLSGSMAQVRRRVTLIKSYRSSSGRRPLLSAVVLLSLCLVALTAGKPIVQASLLYPVADNSNVEERIFTLSTKNGEKSRKVLVTKEDGQWKMQFINDAGKADLSMADAEGKLALPESGAYSRPGTRDLVFEKGPGDKEWKLSAIQMRE